MDPIASIVNGQQAAVMSQIQYAVAAKVLQNEKQTGAAAAVQLIQAASSTADTATSEMLAGAEGIDSSLNVTA